LIVPDCETLNTMSGFKQCKWCKKEQDPMAFPFRHNSPHYIRNLCNDCYEVKRKNKSLAQKPGRPRKGVKLSKINRIHFELDTSMITCHEVERVLQTLFVKYNIHLCDGDVSLTTYSNNSYATVAWPRRKAILAAHEAEVADTLRIFVVNKRRLALSQHSELHLNYTGTILDRPDTPPGSPWVSLLDPPLTPYLTFSE
jgi:hypothetical protein